MSDLKVKVLPEVFGLLVEYVKSLDKENEANLKTEEIQQITFYK